MAASERAAPERSLLPDLGRLNLLLPGLYAWVSTVLQPAWSRGTPTLSRVTAALALAPLLLGPWLARRRPVAGRRLGVLGFVALALITWLALGPAIAPSRLEPLRAALGAVGWALFALGWGAPRELGSVPERDPRAVIGPPLPARSEPSRLAGVVLGVALAGVSLLVFLAWRVPRPHVALLAQAVALLASLGLLHAASGVAVALGKPRFMPDPSARLSRSTGALGVAALLAALGFVFTILR
jgi:hypothetical protein